MMNGPRRARTRASATALLLVLAGAAIGVTADRLWFNPASLEAMSLTSSAMAQRLGLTPTQTADVQALLDSLHAEIVAVVLERPDSLASIVQSAQQRIEGQQRPAQYSRYPHPALKTHAAALSRLCQRQAGRGATCQQAFARAFE